MKFEFTEEQNILIRSLSRVCKEQFESNAVVADETQEFPWENQKTLAKMGLFGLTCPEKYDGSDLGMLSLVLVIEEIAKVCASTAHMLSTQALVMDAFVLKGNNDQNTKWLRSLGQGSLLGAIAITEPDAGSDISNIKTSAIKQGNNYVINGVKRFITHGHSAGVILVLAYTEKSQKHKGMSLLIVPEGTPGMNKGKKERKMGLRGSDTADLIFDNCIISEKNLIGRPGDGFKIVLNMLNASRLGVAAEAVGIAQGALDHVVAYSKHRRQFEQRIVDFQGIQWTIAEMALKIELARNMLYRGCRCLEKDRNDPEIRCVSAMAKWFASDVAMEVTTNAVQLLGGYGYVKDYPVERMMRDAKITQIYEGTNEILRNIVGNHIVNQ